MNVSKSRIGISRRHFLATTGFATGAAVLAGRSLLGAEEGIVCNCLPGLTRLLAAAYDHRTR